MEVFLFALVVIIGCMLLFAAYSITKLSKEVVAQVKAGIDSAAVSDKNAKLSEENANLREKQTEYRRFFGLALSTIREDTTFMRSSLFKSLGSADAFQDINHQIQAFQSRLDAIEHTLREYRMIETYEDD